MLHREEIIVLYKDQLLLHDFDPYFQIFIRANNGQIYARNCLDKLGQREGTWSDIKHGRRTNFLSQKAWCALSNFHDF